MLNMRAVQPTKLTLDTEFKFCCHKGITCFTQCCKAIDILLTPYDILRMKKRLGLTSEEFLEQYTYLHIDERSLYPYAMLKMRDNEEKTCPFVTPEGCSTYEDHFATCRYYPISQGIITKGSDRGPVNEEFYFFIREPHCLGYQEDKEWTIATWRIDQGVDIYDEMNSEWKEIQLMRNIFGGSELGPKKQAQLYMASYDIDRFRRFIFESRFLNIFDIDEENVEKIKTDDIALMRFGFQYLKYILMMEKTLTIKKESKDLGQGL